MVHFFVRYFPRKPLGYSGLIQLLFETRLFPVWRSMQSPQGPAGESRDHRDAQDLRSYDFAIFTSRKAGGILDESNLDQIVHAAQSEAHDTCGVIIEAPDINVVRYLMEELKPGAYVNIVSGDGGLTGFRPDLDLRISKYIQGGSQNYFTKNTFPYAVGENVVEGVKLFVRTIENDGFKKVITPIFAISTEKSKQGYITVLHAEGTHVTRFMGRYSDLHDSIKRIGWRCPPYAIARTMLSTLKEAAFEGLCSCFGGDRFHAPDLCEVEVDGKKIDGGYTALLASTLKKTGTYGLDGLIAGRASLRSQDPQGKGRLIIGNWPLSRLVNHLPDIFLKGCLCDDGTLYDGYASRVTINPEPALYSDRSFGPGRVAILNGDMLPLNEVYHLDASEIPVYVPPIPEPMTWKQRAKGIIKDYKGKLKDAQGHRPRIWDI